jgi:hypothetical protein
LPGDFNIDHPENLDMVNWIINQGFVEPVMKTFCRPVPRKRVCNFSYQSIYSSSIKHPSFFPRQELHYEILVAWFGRFYTDFYSAPRRALSR